MGARLQAFLILFILIALPAGAYWYFYDSKVTAIAFTNTSDTPYTIELRGAIAYKYFPILDRAFYYKSTCRGACIFRPIPPIPYEITITGTGMETIEDRFMPTLGIISSYAVNLTPALITRPLGAHMDQISLGETDIGIGQNDEIISLVPIDTIRTDIVSSRREKPIFQVNFPIKKARLDMTRSSIILESRTNEQYIIDIDTGESVIFPQTTGIESVVYHRSAWKIRMGDTLYEYSMNTWQKSIRFTDFIDLSPRWRIGYIGATDSEKRSIRNITSSESQILLLDRKNGREKTLRIGGTIDAFFLYRGLPAILDNSGDISALIFDFSSLE